MLSHPDTRAGKGLHPVEFFSFTHLSLRTRFLVAMGIVFIPLVAVAIGCGIILQHAAGVLNQIVDQPVYKLQATSQLENQIRKAHALVTEYAASPLYTLHTQFDSEAQTVEDVFAEILAKPFLGAQEYTLLSNSRREWKQSTALADLIFTTNEPKAALYQLDQRVNQIMFTLDQIHEAYYSEINAQRAQINETETRFLLIITATLGFGLIGAVVGAVLLARSVLVPLREFEKGLAHFANDDLSYRLTLNNKDELGQLAREFNNMAERLMTHQNELEDLSVRDSLTGLYNRRELETRLHEEIQRARRYNRTFSVLMLDIDYFKDVNDHYGHQAGDEVLVTVADLVRLNVRPVDVVCRYGGEELAVILPETEDKGAQIVAERIRSTIAESLTATSQGDVIRVTVSIGLATFPQDSSAGAGLIHAADQALYAAKQDGRNLVRGH